MRVLHVTNYWERVGGAEIHMHSLAEELLKRGHVCGFFAGSSETELDTPDARVVKRPYFPHANILRDTPLCREFLRFARAFRPDLIHVHKLVAFPAEIVLALRACRVPLLKSIYDSSLFCPNAWCVWPDGTVCGGGPGRKCFEHGCETNSYYDARVVLATHMRYRLIRRVVDGFLCPTEHLAEMCRAHGFQGVHTLPYYPPHDGAATRSAHTATHEQDRILCISRLEKEKGVSVLLDAFGLVRKSRPSARLSIVGGGPESERLLTRAKELELGESVEFHGPAGLEELPRHLARAHVLVMPSIWCEALPLIAFDALAQGLPMVGSDIGGIPTLVRDGITGLLARPRDPHDFAEKIGHILSDDALRSKLADGCRADLSRYSRERHVDRVEDIYGETLAAPRAPRDSPPSLLGGERRAILDRIVVRLDEQEQECISLHKENKWLEELRRGHESQIEWLKEVRRGHESQIERLERAVAAAKDSARKAEAHKGNLAELIASLERKSDDHREAVSRIVKRRVTRTLTRLRGMVKPAPEGKPLLLAIKTVDKAIEVALANGNEEMVRTLETARATLGEHLIRMRAGASVTRPARVTRDEAA